MSLELANSHLALLGNRLGEDLLFDADGLCVFAYGPEGRHTVVLHYLAASDIMLAVCPVCEVPEDAPVDYCAGVLRLNVQSLARFNGTLGLNSEGNALVFMARFNLEGAHAYEFEPFIESFLEGVEEFENLFEDYTIEDAEEPQVPEYSTEPRPFDFIRV